MIDNTKAEVNDALSPRDKATMDDIKAKIGEYVEYENVFIAAIRDNGLTVEEGLEKVLQSFLNDLKIRAYNVDVDLANERECHGCVWLALRDREDWTVIDFEVTAT